MSDEEYIKNISSISTEELFNSLEYYGYDSYYAELWSATIEELKKRIEERPHGKWIPVSEKLPDNETEVLIQFGYSQSMMVGYHILDLTIYPSEFKDQNETGWYDSNDDFIGGTYEAVAWMPLPELYKEEENEGNKME